MPPMNVLKSLFGQMWGNPSNPELIQIDAGQLYLVRPDSIKGSRECIFTDCVTTIRRAGPDFQYQLVVTRAFQEGEVQPEEDAESDEERVFLIDQALGFRFGSLDGDATFAWRDMSGDEGDLWELIANKSVGKGQCKLFEVTLLQCMYERKFLQSHELASEDDLEALKYYEEPTPRSAPSSPNSTATRGLLAATAAATSTVAPASATAATEHEAHDDEAQGEGEDPFEGIPILHRAPAELYLFDLDIDSFVLQEKDATVDMASNGDYDTWIIVRKNNTPFISLHIDSEMNPRFQIGPRAFMFTFHETEGLPGMTWCLRFSEDVFPEWKDKFAIYLWENNNKAPYGKEKPVEQRYIQDAYDDGDIEMADADQEAEPEPEEEEDEEDYSEGEDDYEEEDSQDEVFGRESKNEMLAVGYKNDMSFVTRGNMIGVFAHDRDKVKFRTAIDRIKGMDGKNFTPNKIMLHNQDADMLMLDPLQKNSVYRMDLEYGKIVDEWKVSDNVEVNNIIPDSKYAQMNPQQTLIGHSHNGIFRIDPRVGGNKLVESQFKQYVTKNDFSAAATTESGKLAVASNKGDIRLFDTIGKNAKTALPALGDPILGIDVSADGRWVVATCKTYLLLIDTLIGDGRYKGSLGFDRSFPADSKPIPRRLQLKPEHVAYMEDPVSFTPARFNTGLNEAEKTIVTSTGKYIITWNFRRLKQGRTDDYQIKKYDSRVVADNFKYGADKNIIVALEHDVLMANKSQLSKATRTSLAPSRASLTTPVSQLRQGGESHSSIVNSPY